MRDQANSIHPVRALSPAAATVDNTPFVCQIIDRKGYDSLTYILNFGALADADVTTTVLLEESDDPAMAGAVAVDDIDLVGTEVLAAARFDDDNEPRKLGYVGNKRYTRLTVTPANNTGNLFLSVTALLGRPALRPTANPPI